MGKENAISLLERSTDLAYLIYTTDSGEYGFYISPELETELEEIKQDSLN
jgi:hypothetical protein